MTASFLHYISLFLSVFFVTNKMRLPCLPASELAKSEYPWTGLGYTFNWASKLDPSIKEFGLSEFVLWGTKDQMSSSGKVPAVEFNRSFTTEEYCKPDNSL
jgi:hypothetical protein